MFSGKFVLLFEVVQATIDNLDRSPGFGVGWVGWYLAEGFNDVVSLDDLAENNVLLVEPTCLGEKDEELGAVGVLTVVRHGYPTGASVGEGEIFVIETLSVDTLPSCAVPDGDVSHLEHEVRHDSVDRCVLVVEHLATFLVSLGDGGEVHDGHWGSITEQSDCEPTCVVLNVKE